MDPIALMHSISQTIANGLNVVIVVMLIIIVASALYLRFR